MGNVETPEIPTKEEATAGSSAQPSIEKEKLLPAGRLAETEKQPAPPPILRAADLLHHGNAIAAIAAERAAVEKIESVPIPEQGDGTLLERSIREIGLKEGPPHAEPEPAPIAAPEKASPEAEGLPRLRTYAEDMSEEIRKRGATLSTIITAEKARAPEPEPTIPPGRRRLLVIGATTLFILGISAIVIVFILIPKSPDVIAMRASIIPVNHQASVALDPKTPLSETLAATRNAATMNLGEVEELDVVSNGVALSPEEVLTDLGAPNELARNATGILVGVHAFDGNQPFLLISVSAYDIAFAGMLAWEPTIGPALGDFFAPKTVTVGSGTQPPGLSFTDRVVENLDARETQDSWPILYAFPRQDLLLVTTNENTLREVLTRLSLQGSGAE